MLLAAVLSVFVEREQRTPSRRVLSKQQMQAHITQNLTPNPKQQRSTSLKHFKQINNKETALHV